MNPAGCDVFFSQECFFVTKSPQSEMEQALNAMRVDEHKTVMALSSAESSLLDRRNKKKLGDTPVAEATHTDTMME